MKKFSLNKLRFFHSTDLSRYLLVNHKDRKPYLQGTRFYKLTLRILIAQSNF